MITHKISGRSVLTVLDLLLMHTQASNMNTASLLVSFLYTAEKVASLSSTLSLSLSFGSKMIFSLFEPSTPTRVRLPTISVGPTTSSRIDSCTEVRVRDRGRTLRPFRLKLSLRMVRLATNTTCLLLNFFSSSRMRRPWIFRTAFHTLKGNQQTTAL